MTMAKLKEGCWNCKFWRGSDHERSSGSYHQSECRKNAPIFLGTISTHVASESTGWPKTYNQDWCGGWSATQPDEQLSNT